MNTLKSLTAAVVLALSASIASAAYADGPSARASFKATPVQYDGRYDNDRRDWDRDGDRGRDYDRGRDNDRYDNDRGRYDRDRDRRGDGYGYRDQRGGYGGNYYRSRVRAWDWDGDGVPNRYDSRPRNPWRS